MRYRLTIEYDGTPFYGWQSQRGGGGVQDALAAAVKGFCDEDATVFGAGRTDTGVHARGQIAHLDLATAPTPDKLMAGLNYHLKPQPVAVVAAAYAQADFDARFSATARHYTYRILARRAVPALDRARVWFVPQKLSLAPMQQAAALLVGKHDFTTFRSVQCQAKSPVKTLSHLEVSAQGEEFVITAAAPSFLHNQVRSLAGALKHVGEGKWHPDEVRKALEACDRALCPPVAPACGLTLMQVDYPAAILTPPKSDI
jgi:tRNA pseudouridine38-40 synthase